MPRVALLFALLLTLLRAPATSAVDGWVNWDRQVIKAVGHGIAPKGIDDPAQAALLAKRAAIADAYRNLASVIGGVRVTGVTRVRDYVTQSDEVKLRVNAVVKGARVISEKQTGGLYEVIMQAPMTGNQGLIAGLASETLSSDIQVSTPAETNPSGLIIDARGLGVLPSISPKVYDEDGAEVYGTLRVSADAAIETGIAAFPSTMADALKSPRVGTAPLIVKALRRGPRFDTDVVVSNADADAIRRADSSTGILPACRVSIAIGK